MLDVLIVVVQALLLVLVANRFLGRLFLWAFRSRSEPLDEGFQPHVTVVIPMFNEGDGIAKTIDSLLAQDYDPDKLDVIVVDDCSTDDSYKCARLAAESESRVRVIRNPQNMGKRRSINRAVRMAERSDIIVSVDSDVVVRESAIRLLLRHFTSPDMAAVGGRVDIVNKHDNWLTRMQSIKYFYSYFFTKGLEPAFKSVMCLSGCLTAYRRSVLLELEPILEERALLGVPIKYGEDRFLTRHIIKAGYKTTMTLDAVCKTKGVDNLTGYFAQQLRWRRSNIVDYMAGLSHVWKQHPAVAIHYFASCAGLFTYATLVAHSLFTGWFWQLMLAQLGLNALMGAVYVVMSRNEPAEEKVSPFYILFLGFLTPITYCVLLPLAMFTLDSGSWETRGHEDPDAIPQPATAGETVAELAVAEAELAPVIGIQQRRRATMLRAHRIKRRSRSVSARDRHRTAL